MDDYGTCTWDLDLFTVLQTMIDDLSGQGFKTIVMINPGVKVDNDYVVYRQGLENGYFCTRPDGEIVIVPVWPSKCTFPDFTNPEVRDWWGSLYEDMIAHQKINGIWNDMNEPAVFEVSSKTFPTDIRHQFDGHPCIHKKAHNIYGMQMARASLEGMKKHNPGKRPFLLTRANFAGGQRYAALCTGDNVASWDHLKLASEQALRLSISGYSSVGSDVGGFVKEPGAELFTRWLQLAIFHPLFRNHSMGYNVDGAAAVKKEEVELRMSELDSDQEPWTFGEHYTAINRSVIELRYRLLHYLYTAFYKYVQRGTPILRPLGYYDQSDRQAVKQNDEFIVGDHLLVSPVFEEGATGIDTYFPRGDWYDYRSNRLLEGGQKHHIEAPLEEIPFFIRAGAVLPLREVMQYTTERDPEQLELNVYYSDTPAESQLYEDAEEGYDYREGDYRLTTFALTPGRGALTLTAKREGSYEPGYHKTVINLIGLPSEPSVIRVDGEEVSVNREKAGG